MKEDIYERGIDPICPLCGFEMESVKINDYWGAKCKNPNCKASKSDIECVTFKGMKDPSILWDDINQKLW